MSEVIVVTPEQLAQIVEDAVARAIAGGERGNKGGLVSKREVCRALRVSAYKLTELVKAGMPVVRLGAQSPRFDVAACVEWLKARA